MEAGKYAEAIAAFESLGDYRDSKAQRENAIHARDYEAADALYAEGQYEQARDAFAALKTYADSADRRRDAIRALDYAAAKDLMRGGKYAQAVDAFAALGNFWDSAAQLDAAKEALYAVAMAERDSWHYQDAIRDFTTLGDYKDSEELIKTCRNERKEAKSLNWGGALGNVIAAGATHTIALETGGTVVACGQNNYQQTDVASWTGIVAIAAGSSHTIGIEADGTVVLPPAVVVVATAASGLAAVKHAGAVKLLGKAPHHVDGRAFRRSMQCVRME